MDLQTEKIELTKRLLETEDGSLLLEVKTVLKTMKKTFGTICHNM